MYLEDVRQWAAPSGGAPSSDVAVGVTSEVLIAAGQCDGADVLGVGVGTRRQVQHGDVIGEAGSVAIVVGVAYNTAHLWENQQYQYQCPIISLIYRSYEVLKPF